MLISWRVISLKVFGAKMAMPRFLALDLRLEWTWQEL
jgi:hypothetical protein